MSKRLLGKACIITGADLPAGEAAALRFAQEGALLLLSGIDEQRLRSTVTKVKSFCPSLYSILATPQQNADNIVQTALRQFGTVDVLLHITAEPTGHPLHETPLDEWEQTFSNITDSTFHMCRAVLPCMQAHYRGSIIHLISTAALLGRQGRAALCAAQSAIPALTRSIAIDYAPYNIRANFICTGSALSSLSDGNWEDAANAAVFLASDEATFMTGTSICADGGLTETDLGRSL